MATQTDPEKRRQSTIGNMMEQMKIDRARKMSPSERLKLALELSEICFKLKEAKK